MAYRKGELTDSAIDRNGPVRPLGSRPYQHPLPSLGNRHRAG